MQNANVEILEKCKLVMFAVGLIANERTSEKKAKDGVLVKKESIEFIDAKALSKLSNCRARMESACRISGTKAKFLHGWVQPVENMDCLSAKLDTISEEFEVAKAEFLAAYPAFIQKKIDENPSQAGLIQKFAPSVERLEKDLFISWTDVTLVPNDIKRGQQQFNHLYEQVAWEISQDVSNATKVGDTYTNGTIDVLKRAANKAASFSFLSPSLASVKPAIDKLISRLPQGQKRYSGEDAFLIGAMLAFLSDDKKIANEGRRIGESVSDSKVEPVVVVVEVNTEKEELAF